jgi:hypothetical protein
VESKASDSAGAPIDGSEASLPVAGVFNDVAPARLANGDYRVVYGTMSATSSQVTHFAIDLDCSAHLAAPRTVVGAQPSAWVHEAVSLGDGVAFLVVSSTATSLVIDGPNGVTATDIGPGDTVGALAAGNGTIAVALDSAGSWSWSLFDLDGRRRSGPTTLFAGASNHVASLCWDGSAWSAVLDPDSEVRFVRLDNNGAALLAPILVSDGSGASSLPDMACAADRVAFAWMHSTGVSLPMSLVEHTIFVSELGLDGSVITAPVEVEPPIGRISMLPDVVTGRRLIVSWSSYRDAYDQRLAASAPRCP